MDPRVDTQHFTKAVTELGETRSVVTHSAVYNTRGVKIIDQGVRVDARLYDRLMQHQLKTPLEHCVASEPGVTGQVLRDTTQALFEQEPVFARMAGDAQARELMLDTIHTLPLPTSIAFQLTLARDVRPEVWLHSIRTAVTSAWLANGPGVSRYDVRMLAAGGLLHDLGMLHLDPVLLEPNRQLSEEQQRQLYSHPLVSVMLVECHHNYPRELLHALLEHHETLDGSGYPRNVSGDSLSPWGRVLSLAKTVAAMLAPGRERPQSRLSLLLRMNRHRYDAELVQRVMQFIEPEPAPDTTTAPAVAPGVQGHLVEIDSVLTAWPGAALRGAAGLEAHVLRLEAIETQCAQLKRTLTECGASPSELGLLGDAPLDGDVALELAMVAQEAAWQLRAITRETGRRWAAVAAEAYPAPLAEWLARADHTWRALLAR